VSTRDTPELGDLQRREHRRGCASRDRSWKGGTASSDVSLNVFGQSTMSLVSDAVQEGMMSVKTPVDLTMREEDSRYGDDQDSDGTRKDDSGRGDPLD
jgi:hypothetical protein